VASSPLVVANALLQLSVLPQPLGTHPETAVAARRLSSTHASVQGLLTSLHDIRDSRANAGANLRKLTDNEVDLLRAAIVFAGAGMDAVLKQLTRDSLPQLLKTHPDTAGSLAAFAVRQVNDAQKTVIKWLKSGAIDAAVHSDYVDQLVKGSLQGTGELAAIRNALGLKAAPTLDNSTLGQLDPFFMARNEIAHELDLKHPDRPTDPQRRIRKMEPVRVQCDLALTITASFIVAVDAIL